MTEDNDLILSQGRIVVFKFVDSENDFQFTGSSMCLGSSYKDNVVIPPRNGVCIIRIQTNWVDM